MKSDSQSLTHRRIPMRSHPSSLIQARRNFLATGASGIGTLALASLLRDDGLGSASRNLPGYVVLTAGRGTSGGATSFQSGFLPTSYSGVLFRNKGEPVLNLSNPGGLTDAMQAKTIDALRDLNAHRHAEIN